MVALQIVRLGWATHSYGLQGSSDFLTLHHPAPVRMTRGVAPPLPVGSVCFAGMVIRRTKRSATNRKLAFACIVVLYSQGSFWRSERSGFLRSTLVMVSQRFWLQTDSIRRPSVEIPKMQRISAWSLHKNEALKLEKCKYGVFSAHTGTRTQHSTLDERGSSRVLA